MDKTTSFDDESTLPQEPVRIVKTVLDLVSPLTLPGSHPTGGGGGGGGDGGIGGVGPGPSGDCDW